MILATGGAGFYFQQEASAELTTQVHNQMETVASQEGDKLTQWTDEHRQHVRTLSRDSVFGSGDRTEIATTLLFLHEDQPDSVTAIHYVNTNTGEVLESTAKNWKGANINDTLQWRDSPGLEFRFTQSVGSSQVFQSDGVDKMAFTSPTHANTDSRAVVTMVNTAEITESFRNPIEGGYTQVINSQRTIELAKEPEQMLTTYRGATATALIDREKSGVVELAETDEVVAYAPVSGINWVVVTHAPQSNAYTVISAVRSEFLFVIGIALAGFLILSVTIGRNTVRSLNRLETKATALANGNVQTDIEQTDRIDEVGRLTNSFQETQAYLETATKQTDAIATQDFDAPVLDEEVPGTLGDSLDRTRTDLEQSIKALEFARKETETARKEAEEMATALTEQAAAYSETMEQVSDGDMTQRMTVDGREAAMDRIGTEFNEMVDELEKTIGQLQSYVDEVETAGAEVEHSVNTVRTASEQIASSIQKISDDAHNQREQFEHLSETLGEITTEMDSIAAETERSDIKQLSKQLKETESAVTEMIDLSQQTMSEAQTVAGAAQEQAAELNGVAERADDLQRYAEPLRIILEQFETEQQHEFVLSIGSTGSMSPSKLPGADEQ